MIGFAGRESLNHTGFCGPELDTGFGALTLGASGWVELYLLLVFK